MLVGDPLWIQALCIQKRIFVFCKDLEALLHLLSILKNAEMNQSTWSIYNRPGEGREEALDVATLHFPSSFITGYADRGQWVL